MTSLQLHLKVVLRKKLNEQRRRRSMEHWQISSSYDALLRDPVQAKAMCNGINHETGEVLEGPMTDSVYAKLMEHMGLGEGPSGRGDVKASTMIIAAEDLEGLTMPTSMSIDKADVLGAMAAAEAAVHVSAAGELAAELAAEAPQDMAEPEGCMTALRRTLGVVAGRQPSFDDAFLHDVNSALYRWRSCCMRPLTCLLTAVDRRLVRRGVRGHRRGDQWRQRRDRRVQQCGVCAREVLVGLKTD